MSKPQETLPLKRAVHLVLRVPKGGNPIEWIIEQHNKILRERGVVWIGVWGRPMSLNLHQQLSQQIETSIPTVLFLVQRSADSFSCYKGNVSDIANKLDHTIRGLTPSYYADLQFLAHVKNWLRLSAITRASGGEVEKLLMHTTGRPLVDVLKSSMLTFGSVSYR